MKGFYIEITNNLLDPKHVKGMGAAIWEYLWCIDKMTSVDEEGVGKVLGGKPIKWREVKKDLGKDESTISENMTKLSETGYINLKRTPFGNIITVNKAKKRFGRETSEKTKSEIGKDENGLRETPNLTSENAINKEDSNSKTIQKDNTVADKAATDRKGKKKKNYDDPTPWTLPEFYESCSKSPQRHIRILADYADEKKLNFNTKGQWYAFIDRNVRAARALSPYTDDQITKAMKTIEKERKRSGSRGYLTRWTLETLAKYLDEDGT